MNTHIEQYLDAVCGEIKYKAAHNAIREELAEHITELQEAYLAQGDDETAATKKALAQMGDAKEVGRQLHKTHKPQTDWLTLGILALLVGFGCFVLAECQVYTAFNVGARQAAFAGIGLVLAAILYFTDYTKLFKYSFLLYGVGVLLNLWILFAHSDSIGNYWIHIGNFTIDSGALLLCLYALSFAGLAVRWQTERPGDSWFLIGAMALAIVLMGAYHLAKAFVLAIVCLPMLHYSIAHAPWCHQPKKQMTALYGVLAILFLVASFLFVAIEPYRMARLTTFLDPASDPKGSGYVAMQQRTVMANTSWFQGMSEEDAFFETDYGTRFIVPEAHTDLIFTYIIARFGWGVAAALCFVMAALICKMIQLSRKVQDGYGKVICYGVTAFFAAQIICNILMNLTLFPYVGLSLPFISYGGTMLVLDMAMMAIFLNVYRRKNLVTTPSLQQATEKRLLPRIDIKVTWK